ncbi:WRKY transcription factor SUSIBA2 isoform X2 [Beta vulgaris subsp. vulgaris]|nr:WRKY transcription factor SUSIBA2 isoform X2 [Beta vulgaris subsp. vulgaris]
MVINDSGLIKNGMSIAERRATKCGFNASKICVPLFRCNSLLPSSNALCSPYVTVSSDSSPHTLIDSPILLPNSQLSPTTGTFASRRPDGDGHMSTSTSPAHVDKGSDGGSAMFKPCTDTTSLACFHDVDNQVSSTGDLAANINCQSLTSVHPPADFKIPLRLCNDVGMDNHDELLPDRKLSGLTVNPKSSTYQPCDSNIAACLQMPHENGTSVQDDSGIRDYLDREQNEISPYTGSVRIAEDGYNWRKYGQKQVKGSEYPRSYYKCTHGDCQVKKKVERSHDGQITEIIYKGAHNHSKPQSYRKSTLGSSTPFNEISKIGDGSGSSVKANSGSVWRNIQQGYTDVASDWKIDGLERTSPTSVVTEASDPLSTTRGKQTGVLESAGTPEFSSTMASHEDDEEDAATKGNFVIAHECENEPDLKRRKKDGCFVETTLGSRAVREPRVVLQLESDVDIHDDGYRWRKYGQKVVKGNPNPRSYYKCTATGCTVRKHVERSSQSKKFVITTYEGKHNHELPVARNSSHANSGSGSLPVAATSTHTVLTLPRNSHISKPEPHVEDLPLHLDTKMECGNEFLRPNFLGNIGSGTSVYPMKFPALPNSTSYGPFDLSSQHPAYASTIIPALPDISFPLPLGFSRSVASYCNPDILYSSVQSSMYPGPQLKQSDVKFLRPKQERKDDSFIETELHTIDQTNTSSLLYNHVSGTFHS